MLKANIKEAAQKLTVLGVGFAFILTGVAPLTASAVIENEVTYPGIVAQDYEWDNDDDEVDGVCLGEDEEENEIEVSCDLRGDDSYSPYVDIGFPFEFYGEEYSEAYININGELGFNCPNSNYSNHALPANICDEEEDEGGEDETGARSIFAFWDDIITAPKGLTQTGDGEGDWDWDDNYATIVYKTIGEPGSRKFITQWTNMYLFSDPNIPLGTFQVILYEGSNNIQLQYRNLLGNPERSSGSSATIGIQKDSEIYSQYSYEASNPIHAEMAIKYIPDNEGGYQPANDTATYDPVFLSIPGAPSKPTLNAPANSATNVAKTPVLKWNAATNADSYTVTVSKHSDFSDVVFQSSDLTATQLTAPQVLDDFTTYYWNVKAYNTIGEIFSDTYSFQTSDQVSEPTDTTIPNHGDANNDSIQDETQPNVSSFVSPENHQYVTVVADDACSLNSVSGATESESAVQDAGFSYPAGFSRFTADCGIPGYTSTIQLYYYGVTGDNYILRKYNPNTNAYFNINGATITHTTIDNTPVTIATYSIVDGGQLDMDSQLNGTIVDPVGLALQAVGAPNTGLGGRFND